MISEDRPLNKDRVIKNLKEAYEIRNIICHDFLSSTHKLEVDTAQLTDYILDAALLQYAIFLICSDKIYSINFPIEYDERIRFYQDQVDERQNALNSIYDKIRNSFQSEIQKKNLEDNIEAFEKYVNNDIKNIGRFWFNEFDENFPFIDLALEHKVKLLDQRVKILQDEINSS